MPTRREFLNGCSAAIAAMAGARVTGMEWAQEDTPGDHPILVVLFLRGGMDGLAMLAPVDDANYVAARGPGLRVDAEGKEAGLAIDSAYAGGDFRLHHRAGGLRELYQNKSLALVHACGLTSGTRSHFEAMDLIERGVAKVEFQNLSTGWLARHFAMTRAGGDMAALSVGGTQANALLGMPNAVAFYNAEAVNFYGGEDQQKALAALYAGNDMLAASGRAALGRLQNFRAKVPRKPDGSVAPYQPRAGVKYPNGELGNALRGLAQIVKMDVGMRAATVDFGGWDTHQQQQYQFDYRAQHLSESLAAFYADLADYHPRLTVVVMSEFGRRLKANQSAGTDHGHGNLMMVLGGRVAGGKCYGKWPGLANDQLDQQMDLAITTDYRVVLAEILEKQMGNAKANSVFPGYEGGSRLGVLR